MIAKSYKWSAKELAWRKKHGIADTDYIGAKPTKPRRKAKR